MVISVDEIINLKKIIFGKEYIERGIPGPFKYLIEYKKWGVGNSDYLKLYVTTHESNPDLNLRSDNILKLNDKIILLSFECNEIINISQSIITLNKIEFNHYLQITTTVPEKYHPSFKSFKVFNKVFYINDREEESAIHTITKNNYTKELYKFTPIYHQSKSIILAETKYESTSNLLF